MNIYYGDELDEYLRQAVFSEVLCILKECLAVLPERLSLGCVL